MHEFYMARALRLAEKGTYFTHPNPRVGCVLVKDDSIVAEGHTQCAGDDHAEVDALHKAGDGAKGATAYVTLEPCCFEGKTGACTRALIRAGIHRLVYAMKDPHPKVNGRGLKELESSGIEVIGPLLKSSAENINRGFVKLHTRGVPWTICKLGMSIDGKIALANGHSQWITSANARQDVQRLRAACGAIVTGVQTVIDDDPSLTVRAAELGIDNDSVAQKAQEIDRIRVILDSKGRMPATAKVLKGPQPALIATTLADYPLKGVSTLTLPATVQGRVDLSSLLGHLAEEECTEVLFECGPGLAGSLLQEGLLDELIIYMSGRILGHQARSLFEIAEILSIDDAVSLNIVDVRHVGEDIKLTLRP